MKNREFLDKILSDIEKEEIRELDNGKVKRIEIMNSFDVMKQLQNLLCKSTKGDSKCYAESLEKLLDNIAWYELKVRELETLSARQYIKNATLIKINREKTLKCDKLISENRDLKNKNKDLRIEIAKNEGQIV